MNIVLATPPVAGSAWGVGSYPPLGLLYLAACVKHLPEVKVRIVDAYAEGLDVANACERVMSYSPDMFGLSATSMTFRGGWELLKRVKEARRDILTILGGFHATLFDRVLLREIEEVDVVARGEAERSFPQLCESLIRGHGISGISGISYRFRGEVVSAELQMIEDLDSLPFPDRSILDYDGYGTQWGGFTLPMVPHLATMVSSRGCIYNCTFCADKVLKTSKWRPRSADGVFLELQELSRNGSKTIFFVDENFAGDVGRVDDICHKIIGQHLKIRL
ncbi:MAG: cobalamin-dependent protein, partial [Deltaproteobacteria bacterium]|nr:cobalamin-dependent protein [Deltaproteobacteria bacterium]